MRAVYLSNRKTKQIDHTYFPPARILAHAFGGVKRKARSLYETWLLSIYFRRVAKYAPSTKASAPAAVPTPAVINGLREP